MAAGSRAAQFVPRLLPLTNKVASLHYSVPATCCLHAASHWLESTAPNKDRVAYLPEFYFLASALHPIVVSSSRWLSSGRAAIASYYAS